MCLRLILCTVLLVSVTIILSSSSSEHRLRRRSHSWKACEPFILPSNAEWIRRWYGRRCKGLFVCCEGYELVVKTVCNKRGRWKVKTFCVPRRTTRKTTPTASTTTPTTSSTTSSSTPSSTTSSSTPSPTASSTTPSTSPTTSDPVIQCDVNPTIENGVITSEISTSVGSIVQFNCSSGFTLNGRFGTLTCSQNGDFVADFDCEDCRFQDMESTIGVFDDTVLIAESEDACEELCNTDSNCISSTFSDTTCIFSFLIEEIPNNTNDIEFCRQACFNNSKCAAFSATVVISQNAVCRLFSKPFDAFLGDTKTASNCI